MRLLGLAISLSFLGLQAVLGQGGVPIHVDGPTSTTADPALEKFLPSTNAYARRLVTDQFSLVDDLKKIEPEVLGVFHRKVQPWDIANKGKSFNATDVVMDNAPMRRFVVAGSAPGMWFILYEHGGIGYHHNLVVFSKNGHWRIVASVTGFVKENNFESLKEAVKAGKFFSQPGYPQF
jgi:hypothetical protein